MLPSHPREENSHSDPSSSLGRPRSSRDPLGARAHSLSPQKRDKKQPLHIRLNLTETQMDKITDAFAYKVTGSHKQHGDDSADTPSKSSHRRNNSSLTRPQPTVSDETMADQSSQRSPTFSELMPSSSRYSSPRATLAERRNKQTPPPIHVGNGKPAVHLPRWPNMESVVEAVSPLREDIESPIDPWLDYRVSRYSQDTHENSSFGSPARQAATHVHPNRLSNSSNPSMYSTWTRPGGPFISPEVTPRAYPVSHKLQRINAIMNGDNRRSTVAELVSQSPVHISPQETNYDEKESPQFSPLSLYFRGQGFPSLKIGEKVLIGPKGWLVRDDNTPDKEKRSPPKKSLLDGIKKIAKDMTELHVSSRRQQANAKEAFGANMTISLDAREQSLLYCELEYHLTSALNDYIVFELDRGHLDPDKLKKIADAWQQLGRPRVVSFRYDLETQLELVSLHIDSFVFHGRRQGNPSEIAGLLHAMKTNARDMRVHTFCQPDSVIAKQLVDSQSLFNLIDVADFQQRALAEIAQFFKTIVERELDAEKQRERYTQKQRENQLEVLGTVNDSSREYKNKRN